MPANEFQQLIARHDQAEMAACDFLDTLGTDERVKLIARICQMPETNHFEFAAKVMAKLGFQHAYILSIRRADECSEST